MRKSIPFISILVLAAVLCFPALTWAQSKPSVELVVDRIDKLYRADSSYTVMEMEITTPHWSRTLKMKAWTEGMDRMLIRILEPQKERGVGTLRIGNEMWNYLPKTNKVMKIPPSMMMSSWMGSDFKNNDLVKEFTFTEDYTFRYTEVDNPEANTLYLKCIPKPGKPIVWGHVIIAVDADSLLPEWERFYDDDGELMRVMHFREVQTLDNRRIPSVLELIPKTKEGHKTVLRYLEADFNIEIKDSRFSLRNLRSFRR
jgi:outer membrane lipoprotein-sorting protein